jgi:hypothetical protein
MSLGTAVSADPGPAPGPLRGLVEILADPKYEGIHEDLADLMALPPLERFVAVLELYGGVVARLPQHEQRACYARLFEVLRFGRALGSAPRA